jgi:hypothetical protein
MTSTESSVSRCHCPAKAFTAYYRSQWDLAWEWDGTWSSEDCPS